MKQRSGFGWLELISGVLMIALGIMVFVIPNLIMTGMVYAFGLAAVVIGVADIVLFIRVERYTGFGPILSLITGIMSVMSGVALMIYPTLGAIVLTLFFPIWFIAHCISELTRTNLIRLIGNPFYYYFSLILNILGLVLGFVMIFSPALSFVTLRAICYMVAIYLILFGIESIIAAFARRNSDS